MILYKAVKWVAQQVTRYDIYAKTITFTYNGKDTYNTFIGGITTLSIMSVMLVYGINLFLIMINRKGTNSSINTTINDLNNDQEVLNLGNTTFEFGINFGYNVNGEYISFQQNDSYFTLYIAQKYEEVNGSETVETTNAIEYSK